MESVRNTENRTLYAGRSVKDILIYSLWNGKWHNVAWQDGSSNVYRNALSQEFKFLMPVLRKSWIKTVFYL